MKKLVTIIIVFAALLGCQEKREKITDSKDYDKYLNTANTPSKDAVPDVVLFQVIVSADVRIVPEPPPIKNT